MTAFLVLLAAPLAGALASIALPGRAASGAAAAAVAATLAAAIVLTGRVLAQGVLRIEPGGWAPPLGIALEADGLSAVLVAMTAVVMTAAALAARHELAPARAGERAAFGFWPLMLLLWAALNAVFLSRDLFNLYVGLELVSLAAIGLVAIDGRAAAFAAAFRYMTFALAGSLLYLAGVILIYAAHGTLDMALLAGREPAAPDALALALMTGGLMAKTALFPFHVWLPPAHGSAPAPASAILSALVPKASFVILLRLWLETMPDRATDAALVTMAALGAAAVIWGSLRAMAQARLKLIVAYSTVAQIGYLFLFFPLAGGAARDAAWAADARGGAVLLIVSHALAKSAMFLAAGQWMRRAGSDRLDHLRGLATTMPMSVAAFALAAVTLAGLPPSGGFMAKYLLMTAAFASGHWIMALIIAAGGVLAAVYLYRPMAAVFERAPESPPGPLPVPVHVPVPRAQQLVPLTLAGLSVLLGFAATGLLEVLAIGRAGAAGADP